MGAYAQFVYLVIFLGVALFLGYLVAIYEKK